MECLVLGVGMRMPGVFLHGSEALFKEAAVCLGFEKSDVRIGLELGCGRSDLVQERVHGLVGIRTPWRTDQEVSAVRFGFSSEDADAERSLTIRVQKPVGPLAAQSPFVPPMAVQEETKVGQAEGAVLGRRDGAFGRFIDGPHVGQRQQAFFQPFTERFGHAIRGQLPKIKAFKAIFRQNDCFFTDYCP